MEGNITNYPSIDQKRLLLEIQDDLRRLKKDTNLIKVELKCLLAKLDIKPKKDNTWWWAAVGR